MRFDGVGDRVDDEVVGACDEVRFRRHVRQEGDVHLLALGRQSQVRRFAIPLRVEDGRSVILRNVSRYDDDCCSLLQRKQRNWLFHCIFMFH